MAVPADKLYTPDEYFALEEQSQVRHEYYAGRMYMMAGTSVPHNQIVLNAAAALLQAFRGTPCRAFAESIKVAIERHHHPMYTYPDVLGICGTIEYEGNRQDTVKNPVLIVEVWSDSTRSYDQGDKFEFYRLVPSLQEYVMIDQKRMHVERFRKDGRFWVLATFENPDDLLELASVGVTIPLAALYEQVEI